MPQRSSPVRTLRALSTTIVVLAALAASTPPAEASCSGATALSVNNTDRGSGSTLYSITLSSAGVLTLDVSSPAPAVQPMIEFLGSTTTCTEVAGHGTDFDFVQQTPKWLTLRIDISSSTTYHLRVAPQDEKQTLGDYKLRMSWIADPATPEVTDLSPDATDTCSASSSAVSGDFDGTHYVVVTDGVGQWDPDIMQLAATVPGVLLIENEDVEGPDLYAGLYSGTACSAAASVGSVILSGAAGHLASVIHASDYTLWVGAYGSSSGTYEVAVKFFAPCDLGETDDHGDSSLCATPIGLAGSPSGEISNSEGDDEDWFTFVLSAQTTLEIETAGVTDTYGSLYNGVGQRLEIDDDDGNDGNFRIARTLGPGRYYVRVERTGGSEDDYELSLEEAE